MFERRRRFEAPVARAARRHHRKVVVVDDGAVLAQTERDIGAALQPRCRIVVPLAFAADRDDAGERVVVGERDTDRVDGERRRQMEAIGDGVLAVGGSECARKIARVSTVGGGREPLHAREFRVRVCAQAAEDAQIAQRRAVVEPAQSQVGGARIVECDAVPFEYVAVLFEMQHRRVRDDAAPALQVVARRDGELRGDAFACAVPEDLQARQRVALGARVEDQVALVGRSHLRFGGSRVSARLCVEAAQAAVGAAFDVQADELVIAVVLRGGRLG